MDREDFNRGWSSGLPQTPCGAGSTLERTEVQRRAIPEWAALYRVESIVDIGAGDLNWMQRIEWKRPVKYKALDLVPRSPEVQAFDLTQEIPPPADMGLCLWVLNHLPEETARKALDNLLAARYRVLVYTWWPAMADFLDIGFTDSVIIHPPKQVELRCLARL